MLILFLFLFWICSFGHIYGKMLCNSTVTFINSLWQTIWRWNFLSTWLKFHIIYLCYCHCLAIRFFLCLAWILCHCYVLCILQQQLALDVPWASESLYRKRKFIIQCKLDHRMGLVLLPPFQQNYRGKNLTAKFH